MAAGTWGDVASNRSKQRGRRHRLPEIKDKASIEWEPARQVAGVGDQNAVEGGAFHGPERRRSISDPVWAMLSSPASVRLVRRAYRFRCRRSEEHTSELQSLLRISYAVFCLKKKNKKHNIPLNSCYTLTDRQS